MTDTEVCSTITQCRVSGEADLAPVLDMGLQPLANALLKSVDEPEDRFPLRIGFCAKSRLVQLMETVSKERLFRNYFWVSGTAEGTRQYAQLFCQRAQRAVDKKKFFVVEIASNDGTFLKPFVAEQCKVLGIDPAVNIAQEATMSGVETWPEFWNCAVAVEVVKKRGLADLVFARNVIPHVSELHEVIAGMRDVLADDGVGMIEFHDAGKIMDELHYDSIYHEHLCYFSLSSMEYLLFKHDLHAFHVEISPISGGSIVVHFSKKQRSITSELEAQRKREEESGVNTTAAWIRFSERSAEHRALSLKLIETMGHRKMIGFGSSARSSTYLNYLGIDAGVLPVIVDNNPRKQGLFAPGSKSRIVSVDEGLAMKPEIIFILAWNFSDEIIRDCRSRGFSGKFLQGFPGAPKMISN